MARLPRLCFSDMLHHVIQRGHNGQGIFRQPSDYGLMLDLMLEYSRALQVSVHSYVLMPDHFHLLLTPRTDSGLPKMLQAIGRRYVRYYNSAQSRTGTLWDGRYRCTVLQPERYLMPCMAYIDQNPVRMGLVAHAADYQWSGAGHYIGRRTDMLVSPHAQFWGLGNTPFAREAAYAALLQSQLAADECDRLTDATRKGWALGEPDFVEALQKQTSRRLTRGKPGRPTRTQPT